MRKLGVAAFAIALTFGSAHAAAAPCELHVWPTTNLGGATMGSGTQGLLPALMAGDTTKQVQVLGAVLDPDGQVDQFRELDLVKTFALPSDTQVVFHSPTTVGRWPDKRNAASQASCYFEFWVDQILFNRHPLYGKDILSLFTFRRYGAGDSVAFRMGGRYRTKMETFPKKVEADPASIAAAAALVNEAFATDVTLFGDKVRPRVAKSAGADPS